MISFEYTIIGVPTKSGDGVTVFEKQCLTLRLFGGARMAIPDKNEIREKSTVTGPYIKCIPRLSCVKLKNTHTKRITEAKPAILAH